MSLYRGHAKHAGASERQWATMVRLSKRARMDEDPPAENITTVLESLLAKGFKPSWIIARLEEKIDSRDTYRSRAAKLLRQQFPNEDYGYNPGRRRYYGRNFYADIELFYYH
jgi:hypothetical protein